MFSLSAMPVKFVCLLVLFGFTSLWEARQLARARGRARVDHGLHLLMAVVMLVMVPHSLWAPFHDVVPLPVTIAVMALGVVWFGWRAVQAHPGHRMHSVGCSIMFAAMTWHLTAMWLMMRTMARGGGMAGMGHGGSGHGGMDHGGMTMSPAPSGMDHGGMQHGGMDHGAMTGMEHTMPPAGHDLHWWLAIIGLPLMAWLLWAAGSALVKVFTRDDHRLGRLSDVAMNFGMFWMSTGLLVPVLPFFKHLSF